MRRVITATAWAAWITAAGMAHGQTTKPTAPVVPRPAPAKAQAAPGQVAPAPGQTAAPAVPPVDPRKMDEILKVWESRSVKLTSLQAMFTRKHVEPVWNKTTVFDGVVILKSPNLAFLDYKKLVPNPAKPGSFQAEQDEQIICTGTEVYRYQYRENPKVLTIYELAKEERNRALEEGPFPFMFNMKAEKAKERYRMRVLREEQAYYIIEVLPLLDIDKESFSRALVQLSKSTYLPDRLVLYDTNGKDYNDYKIEQIGVPTKLQDNRFVGVIPKSGWRVERKGARDAVPPAAQGGEAQRPPVPPQRRR